MSIVEETHVLRRELATLAAKPEWDFLTRYDLPGKKLPLTLRGRTFRLGRILLTRIGILPPDITKYSWLPTLKHASSDANARVLLIWAPGVEREKIQRACEGFSLRLRDISSLAPVLVTDVADFAYFSRLGWLVEYLPNWKVSGRNYRHQKLRYLAWRYRDATVVPLAAGWASQEEWATVIQSRAG